MADFEFLTWVNAIGYGGGLISLWALHRQTMIPLRVGMIAGNLRFIAFGLAAGSEPTFILHILLAPLNTYRLIQMMPLVREIKEAAVDGGNSLVLIRSGSLHLQEIDHHVTAGDVLGEIGAFTPENRRTCTAVCETDC